MNLSNMLHGHALRAPERIAAICRDTSISFGALDRGGDRLANALRARGLTPGDRIALYVGNSVALFEAASGIWKAGGVVVPVSTWIVGPELAFMVEDCRPFAVLFGAEQAETVAAALAGRPEVLRIFLGNDAPPGTVSFAALMAEGAAAPPPPLADGIEDAMIAYTSGTTGRPKGAIVTHANLAFQTLHTAALWGLTGDDVFLVTTPIAHRTGFGRLITCFCLGARIVILPRFDAAAALAAIESEAVTILSGVPTVARLLLDHLLTTERRCASLRLMLATGEPFPIQIKHRLKERLPDLRLISFYGMTEAGIPAALGPDQQFERPDSVGQPLPGVEIRLIDDNWADMPPGAPGEVAVRSGPRGQFNVLRGYFNRPEANAQAFKGEWFRTGDVGRFDEDGFLYLVDRTKDMILSGGLNIYSREVEIALESHEDVREVAVVAGPDARFGECVVAYVAAAPGAAPEADALIAHCRASIASYKKPRHVFFVDALPRNINGKIVKSRLRDAARAALGEDAAMP
jgi:long-chain acyl-CoA synthetase